MKRLFLFAPGAGAPSSSPWMRGWATRLGALGRVVPFDYPYMLAGSRRPDPLPTLIAAHAAALEAARRPGDEVVLIGKSMGSRVGCHLSLEVPVSAVVCLGYPLVSASKTKAVRAEVLAKMTTRVLFVQGTRDPLCPLERLAEARAAMTAKSELLVVDEGDHSLAVTAARRKREGLTQDDVDAGILRAIGEFLDQPVLVPSSQVARRPLRCVDSMIHPSTELRFISPTIGSGVFATELIPRGTITWAQCALDRVLSAEDVATLGAAYAPTLDRYAYHNSHNNAVLY